MKKIILVFCFLIIFSIPTYATELTVEQAFLLYKSDKTSKTTKAIINAEIYGQLFFATSIASVYFKNKQIESCLDMKISEWLDIVYDNYKLGIIYGSDDFSLALNAAILNKCFKSYIENKKSN